MRRFACLLVVAIPSAALARPAVLSEFDMSAPHLPKLERFDREIAPILCGPGLPRPGEDIPNAIVVAGLPFVVSGSSCGFRDDYAPGCTFLGGAPDVVYAYTPAVEACVVVDLCRSAYDTAIQVFNGMEENPVACNDDACGLGSRITHLRLVAGQTYYFVVDGWNGDCGTYVLDLRECPEPCDVPAPPGAQDEGEPPCIDDWYDRYNMGCNDWPYVFTHLPCAGTEIVVRGTYGTWSYFGEEFRDTDWYQIEVARRTHLDYSVYGGAPTQIAILDGRLGCGEYGVVCGSVLGDRCETLFCSAEVDPGIYWLFVAPRTFEGVPCNTPYLLRLRGLNCPTIGIATDAWGSVKARYR